MGLPADNHAMHQKFGVHDWVEKNPELYDEFIEHRLKMCQEEVDEAMEAWKQVDPEQLVDSMVDLAVFAIGMCDAFGVDFQKAWDRVHEANMAKSPGVKPERPNPLGLPDLIKPEGWVAPTHEDNHGKLTEWSRIAEGVVENAE